MPGREYENPLSWHFFNILLSFETVNGDIGIVEEGGVELEELSVEGDQEGDQESNQESNQESGQEINLNATQKAIIEMIRDNERVTQQVMSM